ncbi:MAG: GNAT family N-acetyltransferase [Bacteroidia bacterium]|nr:GNAT family N-acetyltransferase [Bacteroidia bacterium]
MKQLEYRYRTASLADSKQLRDLGLLSYGMYFPLLDQDSFLKMKSNLEDESKVIQLLNTSTCFVCEHNSQIVGMAYVFLSGNAWYFFPDNWSYIRMVGINPQHSGNGIAQELTRLCIEHARAHNEKIIALHTSEMMDAARHIYEKLGFKILRELDKRLGKRYWLYTLELANS